jgi:hypothetical protein
MSKQPCTMVDLPARLPGETEREYWRRVERELFGENTRSKGGLHEWTGSPPFHLDRSA